MTTIDTLLHGPDLKHVRAPRSLRATIAAASPIGTTPRSW